MKISTIDGSQFIDVFCKQLSYSFIHKLLVILKIRLMTFLWVIIAPLGVPVEPLVYIIYEILVLFILFKNFNCSLSLYFLKILFYFINTKFLFFK